ncbi:MAG: chemotaxis response regulator protein-glutamate methylesterase [Gammaproteobacteria bacterium]|nr:chemotaxis response regulator protein-glutamate methylesterase [Gammaproteobacteria bacterium]
MTIRVLIVDDSGFFRRRLSEILTSDPTIVVVDMAVDGKEAIEKTINCRPDVITMDIEMPVMNGIDATREIMKRRPTPILMFSSLTYQGAQATLDALEAGATDFLPKRFDDISNDKQEARHILCSRVKALVARSGSGQNTITPSSKPISTHSFQAPRVPHTKSSHSELFTARSSRPFNASEYDVIGIGTSTGGPVALQEVLSQLPENFPLPLLLVQHMPGAFTEAFASRLNQLCKIQVREAKNGDRLEPGVALLAPGGKQMVIERRRGQFAVKVEEETDPMQNYKPCVDVTFNSLVAGMGNRVLGIILTGMGHDGMEACKKLKQRGATIWAQDQASSTIYGMPAAVADIAEQILPLKEVGKKLALDS